MTSDVSVELTFSGLILFEDKYTSWLQSSLHTPTRFGIGIGKFYTPSKYSSQILHRKLMTWGEKGLPFLGMTMRSTFKKLMAAREQTSIHSLAYTQMRYFLMWKVCALTDIYMYKDTQRRAYTHTQEDMQEYISIDKQAYIHPHIHTSTHPHTSKYIHTHTYTHLCPFEEVWEVCVREMAYAPLNPNAIVARRGGMEVLQSNAQELYCTMPILPCRHLR